MYYKYRKPLLLMYYDNYRYGTGLYAPAVHSLNARYRDPEYYYPTTPLPVIRSPPSLPRVPLLDHDLYAPVSYGYGRNLWKPRPPTPREPRISGRYYPYYYGMDDL